MEIKSAINDVIMGRDLSGDDMRSVMHQIMTGECTPAQIGGFLVGLRIKGETIEEISAAAEVMRMLATRVKVDQSGVVDVVGTGGDGLKTFNISTASAMVVAAAGGKVAKHGNRAASSSSGAADVLETAGAALDLDPEQVASCIERIGVGFMFAPAHHGAMKHAIGPRRELGVRTIFNVLGPLTNPAGAANQLLGVFDAALVRPMAEVLNRLGSLHVLVVHGTDGMDEITLGGETQVAELKDGAISEYRISPELFGLNRQPLDNLVVDTADMSLQIIRSVFDGRPGPAADIVSLNAGAAIYVAGIADNLQAGVDIATGVIKSGGAADKFAQFVEYTNQLKNSG